jgi:hypothetical protein
VSGLNLAPGTQRCLALDVGKTCTVRQKPTDLFKTLKKYAPERRFASRSADGIFVITRVA